MTSVFENAHEYLLPMNTFYLYNISQSKLMSLLDIDK